MNSKSFLAIMALLLLVGLVIAPVSAGWFEDFGKILGMDKKLDDAKSNITYKLVEKIQFDNGNLIVKFNPEKKQRIRYFDPDTKQDLGEFEAEYNGTASIIHREKAMAFPVDDSLVIVRER